MENSHEDYTTIRKGTQGVDFKIDPEFENKIPPIGAEEFRQLEENILTAREVYEPLVVWNGTLVDGHNRWKVLQKHSDVTIEWRVRHMDFSDKWAAFEWMYKNQLGRRNLTDEQRTYMIGKMYEARKKSVGGQVGNNNASKRRDQNGLIVTRNRVYEQLADELSVGDTTIKRAEKFAKGIDALRKANPEAADNVLKGKTKLTKRDVAEIGNAEQEDIETVANEIVNEMSISPLPTAKKITRVRVKTPEDMENLQKIEAIVNDMYDPTTAPEFDIDMLIDDIKVNAEIYVQLLANTLTDRSALVTDENKPRIAAAINEVVENIKKVRDSM